MKKNIQENVPGLAFINKLKPVTYNLDLTAADKIIQRPQAKDRNGNAIAPSQEELNVRAEKEKVIYTGFIAQDVEKAAKDLGYDFSGVDAAKNDHDLYGLRYSEFVVPLVKSVQELSQKSDAKDETIKSLLSTVTDLQKQIDDLKNLVSVKSVETKSKSTATKTKSEDDVNLKSSDISSAAESSSLGQNVPNPFGDQTTISFYLPQEVQSAHISVTDLNGRVLKSFELFQRGEGQIAIHGSELQAGTYRYSLVVDGKVVDTRQWVLIH